MAPNPVRVIISQYLFWICTLNYELHWKDFGIVFQEIWEYRAIDVLPINFLVYNKKPYYFYIFKLISNESAERGERERPGEGGSAELNSPYSLTSWGNPLVFPSPVPKTFLYSYMICFYRKTYSWRTNLAYVVEIVMSCRNLLTSVIRAMLCI